MVSPPAGGLDGFFDRVGRRFHVSDGVSVSHASLKVSRRRWSDVGGDEGSAGVSLHGGA
jgi:hypothetical protein